MVECAFCRRAFAEHFVVEVQSKVRWRGNSFDAYQAQGRLGLAVAKALGLDPARKEDFARFTREVSVRDFREHPAIPSGAFDPNEGEAWEFHVGFATPPPPAALEQARQAAVAALRTIPNYVAVDLRRAG